MTFVLLIASLCFLLIQNAEATTYSADISCSHGTYMCQPLAQTALFTVASYQGTKKYKQKRSYSGKVFVFSPRSLKWYAYSNGRLINSGRASGGKSYCRDVRRSCLTPRGHFRVYRKGAHSCRSSKFPLGRGGAPMPYCMFFRGGYAIHGSPDVPNYNASHGCIRVLPKAAKWLHRNFLGIGTRVIVKPY